jgi:large subunit ribosomal protein L6
MRIEESIEIPQGVDVKIEGDQITVKGPKGEVSRKLKYHSVDLELKGNTVRISSDNARKRERSIIGTFTSHVKNLIKGVTTGFEYKMKIVYSHFPMRASVKGDKVVVDNFLGERYPRFADIIDNTDVSVKGDTITLKGASKEGVGQTAANIEKTVRIKGYDPRIFQDGIYIIAKGEQIG